MPCVRGKDRGSGSSLTKIAAGGEAVVLVGLSTATTSREGERPCQTSHLPLGYCLKPDQGTCRESLMGVSEGPTNLGVADKSAFYHVTAENAMLHTYILTGSKTKSR